MEEDKIIKITSTSKEMTFTSVDGKVIPVQTIVKETFYQSGRKDCQVIVEKPFETDSVLKQN